MPAPNKIPDNLRRQNWGDNEAIYRAEGSPWLRSDYPDDDMRNSNAVPPFNRGPADVVTGKVHSKFLDYTDKGRNK